MRTIVCDRCEKSNIIEENNGDIIIFEVSTSISYTGSILIRAELCKKCRDIVAGSVAESITNHRIGKHNFFVK